MQALLCLNNASISCHYLWQLYYGKISCTVLVRMLLLSPLCWQQFWWSWSHWHAFSADPWRGVLMIPDPAPFQPKSLQISVPRPVLSRECQDLVWSRLKCQLLFVEVRQTRLWLVSGSVRAEFRTRIAHKVDCKADCTEECHLFISTKHPHHTYPHFETTRHLMMFHTYK